MKRVAIIIGSASDLKQCLEGLEFLNKQENLTVSVFIRSQHRNTLDLQQLMWELPRLADVVIVGAGWANHLTGCVDAFLRYTVRTTKVPVIGVAFEDKQNSKHTRAAILSITEVPGTQVIYQDKEGIFIGTNGFLRACALSIDESFQVDIILPEHKKSSDLTIQEAIYLASK